MEKASYLYRSPNIAKVIKSRKSRWGGYAERMEEHRSIFKMLIAKLTGKRPLGRPGRRWEDNVRIDLK